MMKCKHCKKSDLGVVVTEVKKFPVRMLNGQPDSVLEEGTTEQTFEVNYCFTCAKAISQEDLYEKENCSVCGCEVDELQDGVCTTCNEEKNRLANMSKEDLILMFMKKNQAEASEPASDVSDLVEKIDEADAKLADDVDVPEENPVEDSKDTTKEDVEDTGDADEIFGEDSVEDSKSLSEETIDNVELPEIEGEDNIINELNDINADDFDFEENDDFGF